MKWHIVFSDNTSFPPPYSFKKLPNHSTHSACLVLFNFPPATNTCNHDTRLHGKSTFLTYCSSGNVCIGRQAHRRPIMLHQTEQNKSHLLSGFLLRGVRLHSAVPLLPALLGWRPHRRWQGCWAARCLEVPRSCAAACTRL